MDEDGLRGRGPEEGGVIAIRRTLRRLLADQNGATAIEYGLIASLIIVAMMGGLSALGGGANGMWGKVTSNVANSM
jgi:pilus assembly protein Flp/PilA